MIFFNVKIEIYAKFSKDGKRFANERILEKPYSRFVHFHYHLRMKFVNLPKFCLYDAKNLINFSSEIHGHLIICKCKNETYKKSHLRSFIFF